MTHENAKDRMLDYQGGWLEGRFLAVPRAVLGLGLTPVAVLVYSLLLNRAELSAKRGLLGSDGLPYVSYAVPRLGKALGVSEKTARRALGELTDMGLVWRREIPGRPSRLYLRIINKNEEKTVENSNRGFSGSPFPSQMYRGVSPNREGPRQNPEASYK